MAHFLRRLNQSQLTEPTHRRPWASRSRKAIARGYLRLASTFLIAGSGLLVVAGLVAAARAGEPLLVLFPLPIVPVWLGAGLLMINSLVTEAIWDDDTLYLSLAFETRAVNWGEILWVRTVPVHVCPFPGGTVLMLLKYMRPARGQAQSAWALLALSNERLSSWPSGAASSRRNLDQP